jgi:hypothetical protein
MGDGKAFWWKDGAGWECPATIRLAKKMKTEIRTFLILLVVAAWVLFPIAVYGQEDVGAPPPTPPANQMNSNIPPVEQALVPEGVLAVQLVAALKIGQTQDQAQAEDMLSALGIEPKNGWIAGYPVTPPIIAEIEKGVAQAADAGKLGLGKNQALRAMGDLKAQLGLNIRQAAGSQSVPQATPRGRPGATTIYKYTDKGGVVHFTDRYDSIPQEYRKQVEMIREEVQPQSSVPPGSEGEEVQPQPPVEAGGEESEAYNYAPNPSPEVINNYYYSEGPPVVTYYPPPEPYYYLYGWVPYPFWCSGFFFSGFFILHDFHRQVFFHKHHFFVTNHVVSGAGNRVFVVDPSTRALRGSRVAGRVTSSQASHSPRAPTNGRSIVGYNRSRMASQEVSIAPNMAHLAPSTSRSIPGRPSAGYQGMPNRHRMAQPMSNYSAPPRFSSESRAFSRSGASARSFPTAAPRVFSTHSFSQGSFGMHFSGGRGSWGRFH